MRILRATAFAAVCGVTAVTTAQNPLMQPGFVAGGPAAVVGTADATQPYGPAGKSENFVNAYGEPFVTPASYCGPGGSCGQMGGCGPMGGGCGPMGGGYGPGGGMGGDPFGGAYMNTEQHGPHFFDFSAEYLYYQRDDGAFGDTVISTDGFANEDLSNVDSQARLRTGDLDAESLNGYRLTGRVDVGALSLFEVAYSGLFSGTSSDSVTVPDTEATARLFSVFSRFGTRTNGDDGTSTPGRPLGTDFQETDFASLHEVSIETEMHNVEALFRRYWVGYNPRVSGTILLGFRYTSLEDRLGFRSIGSTEVAGTTPVQFTADPNLTIDISNEAENRLAGFEVGGDAWLSLIQGLRVGSEIKVGIYDNDYRASTSVVAADGSPNFVGNQLSGNQVAFLTEFKAMAVADVTPCLSIKGGYELLFISDLARAGLGNPYDPAGAVAAGQVSTDGEALFHGFHAGIEYVW